MPVDLGEETSVTALSDGVLSASSMVSTEEVSVRGPVDTPSSLETGFWVVIA